MDDNAAKFLCFGKTSETEKQEAQDSGKMEKKMYVWKGVTNMSRKTREALTEDIQKSMHLMAELHFILLTKEEHQGLTKEDEKWKEYSRPYYEELKDDLNAEAITMSLMMARVQGKEYVSQFTGTIINAHILQGHAVRLLNESKKEDSIVGKIKQKFSLLMNRDKTESYPGEFYGRR